MDKLEILNQCTVNGNYVKLPDVQLDRKLYLEVAKALELIGGKWKGGKIAAFEFKADPTDLLESIKNGDKRNLKKEFPNAVITASGGISGLADVKKLLFCGICEIIVGKALAAGRVTLEELSEVNRHAR